jgi:hypothetical protein
MIYKHYVTSFFFAFQKFNIKPTFCISYRLEKVIFILWEIVASLSLVLYVYIYKFISL